MFTIAPFVSSRLLKKSLTLDIESDKAEHFCAITKIWLGGIILEEKKKEDDFRYSRKRMR